MNKQFSRDEIQIANIHEKMLKIISLWKNVNKNETRFHFTLEWNSQDPKTQRTVNAGKVWEKRYPDLL